MAHMPVAIFGNRERSDIDLILISEDFSGHDYWSRIDILSEAML